jgi:hypothetical protein
MAVAPSAATALETALVAASPPAAAPSSTTLALAPALCTGAMSRASRLRKTTVATKPPSHVVESISNTCPLQRPNSIIGRRPAAAYLASASSRKVASSGSSAPLSTNRWKSGFSAWNSLAIAE